MDNRLMCSEKENEILILSHSNRYTYVGLLYVNQVLKNAGVFNVNKSLIFGLAISVKKGINNPGEFLSERDLKVLGPKLQHWMNIDYFKKSFGFSPSDDFFTGQEMDKHYTDKFYYLDNAEGSFEPWVYCLIYDLAQELTTTKQSVFNYFIGEFYDQLLVPREHNGYKGVGTGDFCGELPDNPDKAKPSYCIVDLPDRHFTGNGIGGEPNGLGRVIYNNDNQFVGYLQRGLMSHGCYFHLLKHYIISLWKERNRTGYTIEQYAEGVVYFGQISDGKKNGLGVIMMTNGSVIMGTWKNNKIDGIIKSYSHVATVFMGTVKNENFTGYGEMYYKNRSHYYGNWGGGQYHGLGVLCYPDDSPNKPQVPCIWNHGIESDIKKYRRQSYETSQSPVDHINYQRDPTNQQQILS